MIYIWFLLTLPHDRFVCELWTRELSKTAIVQACGDQSLDAFRLDVTREGVGVCSVSAAQLEAVQSVCVMPGALDNYRLRIIEPHHQELLPCSVTMSTQTPPSAEDVKRQCPNVSEYQLQFSGTRQPDPKVEACMPPVISQPASISTHEDYYLLAGKLIWYGLAKAHCPNGESGVTLPTFAATPCGMEGAREPTIAWQNSLDDAMLKSASTWHVPADLLKKLIASETQFWSWTGVDGEHGLTQITDDGAALVMHFYQPGYYKLSPFKQYQVRALWLNALDCDSCSPVQARDHARATMDRYAQALSAYYCMYGSWDAALTAWNIKHKEIQ